MYLSFLSFLLLSAWFSEELPTDGRGVPKADIVLKAGSWQKTVFIISRVVAGTGLNMERGVRWYIMVNVNLAECSFTERCLQRRMLFQRYFYVNVAYFISIVRFCADTCSETNVSLK